MSKILIISSGLKHSHAFIEPYLKRLDVYLTERDATVDIRNAMTFDERTFFSYDQIIFVFMNHMDCVPSSTLEIFQKLENQKKSQQEVYAMIICDEYEPEKCDISEKIVRKWCQKENLIFKGALKLGSGLVIMKSVTKFAVSSMLLKFALKIIDHQDVSMKLTLLSLKKFLKKGNHYWFAEMKKKRKEMVKMNH